MSITKNSNLTKIWNKLISSGCTKQGAAGFMGNLYAESRCNPTCTEGLLLQRYKEDGHFNFPYGLYDQKNYDLYVERVNNGTISKAQFLHPRSYTGITYQYGFGLAQWTTESRKNKLWEYTKGKGKSIADIDGQVNLLIYELKNLFPSVWQVVSSTNSINSASDITLMKFESPNNAESYINTRRNYSTEIYNLYKNQTTEKGANTVSVNFNNYYNSLSNSGHDERGQYSGGAAGDQGGEWTICSWYQYPFDGGWLCVLRYPNQKARELLAELSIQAANNNNIGYDQNQRYTYWNQLQAVGYQPSKITTPCEADCSAGVIANTRCVGYLLGIPALQNISASYTGNMRSGFAAAGFQVLTDSKYLTSSAYLMPGDILLNDYDHTCVNLGIGSNSGYSSSGSSDNEKKYNNSTLTTKEIQTRLKAIGWTDLAVDNSYGNKTIAAVKEFQKLYGLEVDGITGPATQKMLTTVYNYVKKDGFDAVYYAKTYSDLKKAYGTDLKMLLWHYWKYGKKEGRKIKATTTSSSTSTAASTKLTLNTTGNYSKTVKKHGVVTADLLNVRKGPGTNYAKISSYPQLAYGNEVDVCDMMMGTDNTKWYYIKIAGKYYGFVNANWLKIS